MRSAGLALVCVLVGQDTRAVPQPPIQLLIHFTAPAGTGFNRRGDSTLSISAPGYQKSFALSGVPDPADPQNTLLRLSDLKVSLPKTLAGRVLLKARLFLCDRVNGVCTVVEQEKALTVGPGQSRLVNWRVTLPVR